MSEFGALFSGRGHGLVLPRSDEEQIDRYVAMHSSERGSVERHPFPRQVDFWAFSIVAALAWDLDPREDPPSRWGKVFIYTSQGILDEDLCSLLAVIAVSKLGSHRSRGGRASANRGSRQPAGGGRLPGRIGQTLRECAAHDPARSRNRARTHPARASATRLRQSRRGSMYEAACFSKRSALHLLAGSRGLLTIPGSPVNLTTVLPQNRQRTAISRTDYSRPIKVALADGLIRPEVSVLDYGCGRGDDVRHLGLRGVRSRGWDPAPLHRR